MKLVVTKNEAELLEAYHIKNFQQLKETYAATQDERLVPLLLKSIGALGSM